MSLETVSSESDTDDSQDRLTRILGAVRLKKVKVERPVPASVDACCPRCGTVMPRGAKPWCVECRYSPQLGRDVTDSEISDGLGAESPRKSLLVPERIWQFRLAAGFLFIFAIGMACRMIWPDSIERAFYGRILLAAGALTWGIAHARAYLVVCRLHRHGPITTLTAMSVFHPIRVWREILRSLPVTRNVFCLGMTGVAVMVMACTLVGIDAEEIRQDVARSWQNQKSGLLSQLAPKATTPLEETKAISTVEIPNETIFADQSPDQEVIPRTSDGLPRDIVGEFHIVGYLTNADGEIRSVLVAQVENNRGRFVGRVPLDGSDSTLINDLQTVLEQHRSSRPPLPLSYQARWVKPVVVCQVAFVEWTSSRTLKDGYLVNFSTMSTPAKLAERSKGETPQRESE
ncbi:MAG TPA: hypothetical protein VNQ76_17700 [Planctomicrobium sp.]|nr:hypothetical protein [Planctomicrobium sp.]